MAGKNDEDNIGLVPGARPKLSESVKKLSNGIKMYLSKPYSEDKGGEVEIHEAVRDGIVTGRYVTKGDKVIETMSTPEAQASGDADKQAKAAGVKKEQTTNTSVNAIARHLTEKDEPNWGEGPENIGSLGEDQADTPHDPEKTTKVEPGKGKTKEVKPKNPKTGKVDSSMSKMASQKTGELAKTDYTITRDKKKPDTLTYTRPPKTPDVVEAPKTEVPNWKKKWDATTPEDKMAFKSKLAAQRSLKDQGPKKLPPKPPMAKSDDQGSNMMNFARSVQMHCEKLSKDTKVEIQPHPPEVIDVDPKIITNMKRRLKGISVVEGGNQPKPKDQWFEDKLKGKNPKPAPKPSLVKNDDEDLDAKIARKNQALSKINNLMRDLKANSNETHQSKYEAEIKANDANNARIAQERGKKSGLQVVPGGKAPVAPKPAAKPNMSTNQKIQAALNAQKGTNPYAEKRHEPASSGITFSDKKTEVPPAKPVKPKPKGALTLVKSGAFGGARTLMSMIQSKGKAQTQSANTPTPVASIDAPMEKTKPQLVRDMMIMKRHTESGRPFRVMAGSHPDHKKLPGHHHTLEKAMEPKQMNEELKKPTSHLSRNVLDAIDSGHDTMFVHQPDKMKKNAVAGYPAQQGMAPLAMSDGAWTPTPHTTRPEVTNALKKADHSQYAASLKHRVQNWAAGKGQRKKIHEQKTKAFNDALMGNPTAPLDKATTVHPAAQEIADAHNKNGGSTYNLKNGHQSGDLYMVSPYEKRTEKIDGPLNSGHVSNFINKNKDLLDQPNHNVGTWHDKDSKKNFLDVSISTPDREHAINLGRKHNQISVFHTGTMTEIPTGGTGEAK